MFTIFGKYQLSISSNLHPYRHETTLFRNISIIKHVSCWKPAFHIRQLASTRNNQLYCIKHLESTRKNQQYYIQQSSPIEIGISSVSHLLTTKSTPIVGKLLKLHPGSDMHRRNATMHRPKGIFHLQASPKRILVIHCKQPILCPRNLHTVAIKSLVEAISYLSSCRSRLRAHISPHIPVPKKLELHINVPRSPWSMTTNQM
jgi:hypothetical protein